MDSHFVMLRVTDDGPGFNEFIFDRLGDPFVTTRPGYDTVTDPTKRAAMRAWGLGFLLPKHCWNVRAPCALGQPQTARPWRRHSPAMAAQQH